MSYRIRRIDPYWLANPVVVGVAIAGALIAVFGFFRGSVAIQIVGAVALAVGVLAATKPVVSGIFGTLGLLGGLVTFVVAPNPALQAGTSMFWRLISALFFAFMYMILMNALVVVVAFLYNAFSETFNLGGIHLDIEEIDGGGA